MSLYRGEIPGARPQMAGRTVRSLRASRRAAHCLPDGLGGRMELVVGCSWECVHWTEASLGVLRIYSEDWEGPVETEQQKQASGFG